ncbi:ABC transporter substrate-binding protein [Streptomyces millisiae]|uniref:ABC transporter substrate-binding protein n=1 Tax=Streptomyces millisiae TaxID=3075542 RepID=A0ABU2LPB2_9ACTN|nr:ABC transporter substrate-binding protein [Streptomyces sp. DSM 44918]MDT0319431.1 ABC transporter substrate-binding protein [Streptomyces sp. DSM 44918]
MRRIRARRATGIGLAVVLLAGAIGGWMYFRSGGGEEDPIVVGSTSTPTVLDPGGAYDAAGAALMSNLFQSLMTYAPGQEEPVPDAAEQCRFTDNQLTVYRCTLREGLVFSNGEEISPEDVQYSFERILSMADRAEREAADDSIPDEEKFAYAGPSSLLATLEAVRVDDQDIIFELNQPDATFPFVVAGSAGAIVEQDSYSSIEPRTDGRVVGSGPFLLEEFRPDEYARLVPNPDYQGAAETPDTPVTVRYFVQADDGTPAEELLAEAWDAGEIDVNNGRMPPSVMAELNRSDSELRVAETTGASIRVMAFNTDQDKPMGNAVARRAAAALLDREAIARHVQQDTVEPLYSLIPVGFTGHGTPYYDQYRDVTPAALRTEMEEAGLELPVRFDLAYSRGVANHAEAALIEQQLEAGGLFEVEIAYYDWAEFIPTIYGARSYDAWLIGWTPDFPDPATFTDTILGPGDGLATGFSDNAINELIGRTHQESDRARASEDFLTIHDLAAGSAPIVPIWQDKRTIISTADISGTQNLVSHSGVWRLWELHRI